MRDKRGSLIAVWAPGNHGAGGSTLANAVGITLQHLTGKETLIVNLGSPRNCLEQYMKGDIDIRFSMDYLLSFDKGISSEHIKTYASAINDKLHILPNCKINREVSGAREGFYQRFLDRAVEAYEIVVLDLEAGLSKENQMLLDRSDVILAVMNDNEIMLEELLARSEAIRAYINDDKTLPVFNGLHSAGEEVKTLKKLNKRLGIGNSYGILYDTKAHKAACSEGKFYSHLKRELGMKRADDSLAEQVKELCGMLTDRIFMTAEITQQPASFIGMIFGRAKQWGEVDV